MMLDRAKAFQGQVRAHPPRRDDDKRAHGYVAEQQYYVYLNSNTITSSWQPYVKNYAPTQSFDYGSRAATLWLDR